MISLIVLCPMGASDGTEAQTAEAVVRTLSAFVGAAVRGLVAKPSSSAPRR